MVSRILAGYQADPWWARLHRQIQANNNLRVDTATLPFVVNFMPPVDTDLYLTLRLASDEDLPARLAVVGEISESLPAPDKSKLLYHVNKITNVHRLCILPSMAPDILAIAHGKSYPGFSRCYKIISRFWYIRGLTKLF